MTDPTPEAYEAAARAISRVATTHGYRLREEREPLSWAAVDAVWPIAEREIRAKVAAEIRTADVWPSGRWGDVQQCRERAARIAEGSDTPWPEISV